MDVHTGLIRSHCHFVCVFGDVISCIAGSSAGHLFCQSNRRWYVSPAYLPLTVSHGLADEVAQQSLFIDHAARSYRAKQCMKDQKVKWEFKITGVKSLWM